MKLSLLVLSIFVVQCYSVSLWKSGDTKMQSTIQAFQAWKTKNVNKANVFKQKFKLPQIQVSTRPKRHVGAEDEQHSTSGSPVEQHPSSESPSEQHSTSANPVEQHPSSESPSEQHSTSANPVEQHPSSESPSEQHSTSGSPVEQHPSSESPSEQHSTSGSPVEQHPRSESPSEQHSTSGSPVEQHPSSESPVPEYPTHGSRVANPKSPIQLVNSNINADSELQWDSGLIDKEIEKNMVSISPEINPDDELRSALGSTIRNGINRVRTPKNQSPGQNSGQNRFQGRPRRLFRSFRRVYSDAHTSMSIFRHFREIMRHFAAILGFGHRDES